MKKKIVAMLLIACMSISAAACGKSEEPKEKVKTEAQKETKEKKEYQKIGVESAEAFDVLVKNSVGADITGITVKTTAQTEYPANMMKSGEVWKTEIWSSCSIHRTHQQLLPRRRIKQSMSDIVYS